MRSLNLGARKVHLRADPARLQQIFWNLINNGGEVHTERWANFHSTSNTSKGELRVEIADTGLGIEPESLPKIFDAFEQGGRTQLGGLGLGWPSAKRLWKHTREQSLRKAPVETKAPRLPSVFPTCEKVAAQIAPDVSPKESNTKLCGFLLVEDHEDTNRSLTNLLRRRGYQVQSAPEFSFCARFER